MQRYATISGRWNLLCLVEDNSSTYERVNVPVFRSVAPQPRRCRQCRFFFSRSRWMGVKQWRVLPEIFRRVLLDGRVTGCWQHRNVLRACPCWSLVCPAPCPGTSTPVATEECIAMHAAVSCRHRTCPCPVTCLAWSHVLAYTLHGRTISRGLPAVARRRATQGTSSQPLASAQETAHGRDTHVWTLCRDSL